MINPSKNLILDIKKNYKFILELNNYISIQKN